MRALTAVRPGPSVTVQDLGRPGMQRFGIPEGGVLDTHAHVLGAALLGQDPRLASLELTVLGGRFRVGSEALEAVVTGARMPVTVDGVRVPPGAVFAVAPNCEIDIGVAEHGVYGYLSVSGGVDTPIALGSRSTHARSGIGGIAIQPGDVIPVGTSGSPARGRAAPPAALDSAAPIRITWGIHAEMFDDASRTRLVEETFSVTEQRDRMGMRLQASTSLMASGTGSLPSAPVVAGDIQVPVDGQPIVLLADRQPTGGYPRIATVIEADRSHLIQRPIGSEVRFEAISLEHATALLIEHRAELDNLGSGVLPERRTPSLWGHNLISGFTVGDGESE